MKTNLLHHHRHLEHCFAPRILQVRKILRISSFQHKKNHQSLQFLICNWNGVQAKRIWKVNIWGGEERKKGKCLREKINVFSSKSDVWERVNRKLIWMMWKNSDMFIPYQLEQLASICHGCMEMFAVGLRFVVIHL